MYNPEQKMAWINTQRLSDSEINKVQLLFERVGELIEEYYDSDLCELSCEQIYDRLQYFDYMTYARIRIDISYLNNYLRWKAIMSGTSLKNNELLTANKISLSESYRKNLLFSTEELRALCSNYKIEDGFLFPVICSLAWMGFTPIKMLELTRDDVRTDGCVVIKGMEAPEGFVADTIRHYATNSSFTRAGTAYYKDESKKFLSRIVVKDSKLSGKAVTRSMIDHMMTGFNATSKRNITISALNLAGQMHRLYDYEVRYGAQRLDESMFYKLCNFTNVRSVYDRKVEYSHYKLIKQERECE